MLIWHWEQQSIIAADMVILRGTEKKWVGHVKFMKYLRWAHCGSISHVSALCVFFFPIYCIDKHASVLFVSKKFSLFSRGDKNIPSQKFVSVLKACCKMPPLLWPTRTNMPIFASSTVPMSSALVRKLREMSLKKHFQSEHRTQPPAYQQEQNK